MGLTNDRIKLMNGTKTGPRWSGVQFLQTHQNYLKGHFFKDLSIARFKSPAVIIVISGSATHTIISL